MVLHFLQTPIIRRFLGAILLFPVIYFGIAGVLIISQWPDDLTTGTKGLDFSKVTSKAAVNPPAPDILPMRDGYSLPVRIYGRENQGPLVVLIHGSGWHGLQYHALATELSKRAVVAVPDLRGHGAAPEKRGDVDHIGQFEEDMADMIDHIQAEGQQVIVAGHSSGGGLVVRMAGGSYKDRMDKAILLAPFLKYDAPTMRPNSGGWAFALTRRLIGLSMLNQVGIKGFNDLTVIQFAMPNSVLKGPLGHTATPSYSYRLNASYAPRNDYLDDVKQLPPFLLLVGKEDEAFIADAFQPLLSSVSDKGNYHLIEGVGHLDIVNNSRAHELIKQFIQ
ncbi:alpha/beta hydrolase [Sneathiella sp.]|jgi:pimeloyl-ACP methyl ester carboxylesterase|uniref:alpha/beta hydrolase n=1 Tax=Sneathiella sp. TaxID=1964365 RepID=UPI0039E4A11A